MAPIVAHVGDGNFHTLILVDPNSPDEVHRAEALHGRMALRAIEMDRTCTGEHGIGFREMKFLDREQATPSN